VALAQVLEDSRMRQLALRADVLGPLDDEPPLASVEPERSVARVGPHDLYSSAAKLVFTEGEDASTKAAALRVEIGRHVAHLIRDHAFVIGRGRAKVRSTRDHSILEQTRHVQGFGIVISRVRHAGLGPGLSKNASTQVVEAHGQNLRDDQLSHGAAPVAW